MYKVLDLAEVGTGTTISDLSKKEKSELKRENAYYEFKTKKQLIEFAKDFALIVEDDEEIDIDFQTVDEAIEYLDMMNYSVE